jgi:hypothetical protein
MHAGMYRQGFVPTFKKRDSMVIKYMSKTGLSKEEAEKEVDEYLADKDAVSKVCMYSVYA